MFHYSKYYYLCLFSLLNCLFTKRANIKFNWVQITLIFLSTIPKQLLLIPSMWHISINNFYIKSNIAINHTDNFKVKKLTTYIEFEIKARLVLFFLQELNPNAEILYFTDQRKNTITYQVADWIWLVSQKLQFLEEMSQMLFCHFFLIFSFSSDLTQTDLLNVVQKIERYFF